MLTSLVVLSLATEPWTVLVFSKTAGFRHASIDSGVKAIQQLGSENGFAVVHTEDAATFDENIGKYKVVIFLNTTGDVLNRSQEEAFEKFHRRGGGFVGIHSASDTEYEWKFYGQVVGAYFSGHPAVQQATIRVLDRTHPSTRHLSDSWVRRDEWYDFKAQPMEHCKVICELEPESYQGRKMSGRQPTVWFHDKFGGRAFYTGGGHTPESFGEPEFRQHLLGAIKWAARLD
ncbi:ThuA domain-containing protein [Kamptonema cortianum]|nr:ThuA domain-containing protein [Geitlerinema splendidum]MDK3157659.1 ThuA domain-containing protein [Kamptonema cortianum]